MRRMLWIPLLLSHCAPWPESPQPGGPAPLPVPAREASPAPAPVATPAVPGPPPAPLIHAAPKWVERRIAGIAFQGVSFDSRSHRLSIADQAAGPASEFADAAAAARSRGAIASLNGGFFDPEGLPLGKVVSQGRDAGFWNDGSSLCSGTFLEDHEGRMAIRSRSATPWPPDSPNRELLQAGPMLVRDGRIVGGLDRAKKASRSLLLWDGGHRWWMGRTDECTLHDLAGALTLRSPAGWSVAQALNLDGGSSSELWVSGSVRGGPKRGSHWWLKPARNYLLLCPRSLDR